MQYSNSIIYGLILMISLSSVSAQKQAQATATIVQGRVSQITVIDPGEGYTVTPMVSIVGGGGYGATAESSLSNGLISHISIKNPGTNYTTAPQVILTPPFDYAQGLLAWWRGETNTNDELGQHHGQIIKGMRYTNGMVGDGFELPPRSYISFGGDEVFNFNHGTGDFTIESWMLPIFVGPHSSEYDILAKVGLDLKSGWVFLYGGPWLFFKNIGHWEVFSSPINSEPGAWFHVAVTKKGSRFTLYHNGQNVGMINNQLTALATNDLSMGSLTGTPLAGATDFISGRTDELAIYNRALTQAEIQEIYNRGSQGKYARPLVTVPPTNTIGFLGSNVTFSPKVMGTPPVAYQWLKQGLPLANATNISLILTNLQGVDEGEYSLLVYNQYGSDTKPVSHLTVKAAQLTLGLTPKLTIEGVPGLTYAIQATTNLEVPVQWQTLTNITLAQPMEVWYDDATDTTLPDHPKRYYQVIVAP